MNILKRYWKNIVAALTGDDAELSIPIAAYVPSQESLKTSPHVVFHAHNPIYLVQGGSPAFEENYVDAPKKRGRKSKFASEEERKAHRKAYTQAYHKEHYANEEYRRKCVERMRAKRREGRESVRTWSARNLGVSSKDRQAYNRAYHEQVKKTGNTPQTFK